MESRLPLRSASIDATMDDIENYESDISIFYSANDLLANYECKEEMSDETIFSLWFNCGENKEKAIMCDIEIDELEKFANAVLKQIEIVRRNYSKQIKFQTDKGCNV